MSDHPAPALHASDPAATAAPSLSAPADAAPLEPVPLEAAAGTIDRPEEEVAPLPPRQPPPAATFAAPIGLGLLGAVAGGLLLTALTGLAFLPCVWDVAVGAVVGTGCVLGLQRGRWTGAWSGFLWTSFCILAAYAVFAVAYYFAWATQFPELPWSFTAIQVMIENKAKNFALPGPLPVGPAGMAAVVGLQIGLAWYIAAKGASQAVRWNLSRTIPPEALARVSQWKREGYKDHHIREALARRGWTDAGDQKQAFLAAEAAARLGR